jgi:predicted DNA-binding transcriptional regulator YafY
MFRGIEYHVPVNHSAVRKQPFLNHKGAKDTDGELWFFASNGGGRAGSRCAPMSYHNPKTGKRRPETGKKNSQTTSNLNGKDGGMTMTMTMKTKSPLKGGWEGIEVPTGVERERMEHIDAALQRVRKLEHNGCSKRDVKLPSAVQFAQELGVKSARTIRRLIQKMQDLYGLPIDWDHSRKGYYYMEDVAFLPFLQFSESELVAVYLTQQLGVFENTPFKAKLKSAFRKLLGLFGQTQKLSFDPELLDECFSFDAAGPHARFRPAHLDACSRAMLRQEELLLTYVKQHGEGAGVPEVRRVRPLHITYRDFAYYVVCQDPKRRDGLPRLFMVTRMERVEETGVRFERPKDFDARAYLEKAFKVFASQEAVTVELHFSPDAAPRVVERRWHHTQKFTKLENGWTKMTMEVGLAPDLYSWIGGFFGDCRVMEPVELKEKMRGLHAEAAGGEI